MNWRFGGYPTEGLGVARLDFEINEIPIESMGVVKSAPKTGLLSP
jgi:hypothetical protein